MKLTGKQFTQLQDALLDAFTELGLRQMTRVQLDTTLEHVAGGDNLSEITFNLVSWAETQGMVPALIAAACAANPENPRLQSVQRDAAAWFAPGPAERVRVTVRSEDAAYPPPPEPRHLPVDTRFVGRERELAYYADRLRQHGIVAIGGMPGVGKTSLAAKLACAFAPETHVFWHEFYQGEDLRSMLWRLAGFLAYHGQAQLWELLNRKGNEPPASSQIDYAFQLVRRQNFVLVLDNVHLLFDRHADDPLLAQMIERLERLAQAAVAQVILVSRSTPQFAQLATAEPLRGLSRQDTDTLLHTNNVHLPEPLRAALYARTEGNVELLVLAVQALQGAEEPATLINRLAKADNVEHYLLVEVDEGLSEEDRQVMTGVAALLGLPATRDAIEQTLERGSLKRTLTYLANRYLLATQQGAHDKEFLQHAVLRDFYYDLLSKRERTVLHRRAAEYYSTVERDSLRAAQQFLRAGRAEDAAVHATEDVYGALARGQVAWLQLCLAELEGAQLPPALAAQVKIAAVELHQYKRDPDAALAAGAAALSLLEMLGDDPKARHATAHVCWVLARVTAPTDPAQAAAYVQRGLDVAPEGDDHLRAMLLIQQGAVHGMRRELVAAEDVLQQALGLLRPDDKVQQFDARLNLGVLRSMQGDLAGGTEHFTAALGLANQMGDPFRQLKARSNLSVNKVQMGDWDGALVDMRYAYDIAQRLGDVRHHAVVALNLGDLLRKRGSYDEAAEVLATALRQAETARFPLAVANTRLNLAHLALALQQYDSAAEHLDAVQQVVEQHNLGDRLPELLFVRAELLLAQGDLVKARECAQTSAAAAHEMGMTEENGIALRVQARILRAEERYTEAVKVLDRSIACLVDASRYDYVLSQLELGLCLERLNDDTRAQSTIQDAQRKLSALGAVQTS